MPSLRLETVASMILSPVARNGNKQLLGDSVSACPGPGIPAPTRLLQEANLPKHPTGAPPMLVLHGLWLPDAGLALWAENSDATVKSRSQALRSARPHPFTAQVDALDAICPGKPGEVTLLLPSLRAAPLDSPELIRAAPRP